LFAGSHQVSLPDSTSLVETTWTTDLVQQLHTATHSTLCTYTTCLSFSSRFITILYHQYSVHSANKLFKCWNVYRRTPLPVRTYPQSTPPLK